MKKSHNPLHVGVGDVVKICLPYGAGSSPFLATVGAVHDRVDIGQDAGIHYQHDEYARDLQKE